MFAIAFMLLCFSGAPAPVRALVETPRAQERMTDDEEEEDEYVPGEVVVKLSQATDLPGVAADYGLDPMPRDQFGTRPIYRLAILNPSVSPPPSNLAEQLEADPQRRVIYAEPNFIAQTPEEGGESWGVGGDAGGFANQSFKNVIRLPEAHTRTRGRGITVAVLDTGVDAAHPELAGRLVAGRDFVDDDFDPSEVGNHEQNPTYGHGTHVAGLVALAAPEASIMPIRVLNPNGKGNIWVLVEALNYAVNPDGNPNTDDGADVINLSLTIKRETELLEEIIEDVTCGDNDEDEDEEGDEAEDDECLAGALGVVVVAATGNSGMIIREYPAAESTPGLLAVAASDETDTLAAFSTRGTWVSVAAPGERILSSVPGGGYGTWNGTSMAAPLTAGQAALVRARYPHLRASEVAARIIEKAATISGPVSRRIDAAAAVGLRPSR